VRIAYDVTPLSHPRTGVGNYILGALTGMLEAGGGHEVVAFGPVSIRGRKVLGASLDGLALRRRTLTVPFAHATRRAWGAVEWPPAERFLGGFDVLHFSDWMRPPQRAGLRATMIHDLGPLHFPERLHPRTVRMHTVNAREAERCDLVFVNSEFTAADAVEQLRIPRERIRVAYPGVGRAFSPGGARVETAEPYVFTTATDDWRKNLGTLRSASSLLSSLRLLTPAEVGYVGEEQLAELYRGAAVFCYPSRFEGFGIPVVEAMACGVPCVVSEHPSLDEVSGNAAVRVDPESAEAIAAGLREAIARRDELVALGLEHAARFSWAETGRVHLQSYADAL
jgi:glycosyltransferase involved in cell wall biosynthesis